MKVKVEIQIHGDPRKGKTWGKIVDGIDESKSNGFCFLGTFVRNGQQLLLEEGEVVLLVATRGSWKNCITYGDIYVVEKDGLELIDSIEYRKVIDIRDKISELLSSNKMN